MMFSQRFLLLRTLSIAMIIICIAGHGLRGVLSDRTTSKRSCSWQTGDYCFGGFNDNCSVQNEAYFLGVHAKYTPVQEIVTPTPSSTPTPKPPVHFLYEDHSESRDEEHTFQYLEQIWTNFVSMTLLTSGYPNKRDFLDMETPYSATDVIKSCDPRDMNYCETNVTSEGEPVSKCKCHPLYSFDMLERDPTGSGFHHKECLTRPEVPCRFNDTAQKLFMDENANCVPNSICTEFKNYGERMEWMKNWHGFGFSPIMTEYLKRNTLRICKCQPPYRTTKMLDCVK